MNDDYLWDGTGERDTDVAALERALAPLAHAAPPLATLPPRQPVTPAWQRHAIAGLLLAATVALVAGSAWIRVASHDAGAWRVSNIAGVARVNGREIVGPSAWRAGERLETGTQDTAQVAVGTIGRVDVGPNSVVTLQRSRQSEHRMSLERGSIRAMIWAPPGLFVVEAPSATAVDLGCAYTLDVDERGAGLLRVEHGWVGFRHEGRESFIPQGAMCATRRERGPGTPYYDDAPPSLASALSVFDFDGPSRHADALATVLAQARPRDAMTLWHLLTRTTGDDRGRVFDRLVQLAPVPAGVTRAGILSGNRPMRDAWWDTLGEGSASWWRIWETPWPR